MAKAPKDKTEEFLKELSALTRRYRISIAGCGCCGSPWLCYEASNKRGKYELSERDNKLCFVSGGR